MGKQHDDQDSPQRLSRREALAKLGGIGAGACLLGLCANCLPSPLASAAQAEVLPNPQRISKSDVAANAALTLTAGDYPVILLHGVDVEGKTERHFWIAYLNRCTHSGCKTKYLPEDQVFHCPCHKSRFDRQGEVVRGPAKKPLKRMRFEVTDDAVLVYPKLAD